MVRKDKMARQLQITLPEDTMQLLDRWLVSSDYPEKEYNNLINEAIKLYIMEPQRNYLKQQLKERAIVRAERDLNLAQDWFSPEEYLW
jgi:CopG family transcriptional regulator/antitoxin EndoAI